MTYYPEPVARLIEALQRLPGIGPKTAQRLTFFLLKRPLDEVRELSGIAPGRQGAHRLLQRPASTSPIRTPAASAPIPRATPSSSAWSRSRTTCSRWSAPASSSGRYHVLLGALSPLDGIGPDDLKVRELLLRLEADGAHAR